MTTVATIDYGGVHQAVYAGCFAFPTLNTTPFASSSTSLEQKSCAAFCVSKTPNQHSIYSGLSKDTCSCYTPSAPFVWDNAQDPAQCSLKCTDGGACGAVAFQTVYFTAADDAANKLTCAEDGNGDCYNTEWATDINNCGKGGNVCTGENPSCSNNQCSNLANAAQSQSSASQAQSSAVSSVSDAASVAPAVSSAPPASSSTAVSSDLPVSSPSAPPSGSSASSAPASSTTASTCTQFHTIADGETCGQILSANGITLDDLRKWNPSVDQYCSNLSIGEVLCVNGPGKTVQSSTSAAPAPTYVSSCTKTVVVVDGNTCSTIASDAKVSLSDFLSWNSDIVGSTCLNLQAGQKLCIAGPVASTTATTTTASSTTVAYIASCLQTATISSGDTCTSILSKNTLILSDFLKWNPFVDQGCSNLMIDEVVCVNAPGKTIQSSTSAVPAPTYVSSCTKTVVVVDGNTCSTIASDAKVALSDFLSWNSDIVGSTCLNLQAGQKLCIAGPVASTTATTTTASSTTVAYIASCLQTATISSGDTCTSILSKNTLLLSDFLKWNPFVDQGCSNLMIGEVVCVNAPGKTIQSSTSAAPSPTYVSSCTKTVTVVDGNTCSTIASDAKVALSDFLSWNSNIVGSTCLNLQAGQKLCIAGPVASTTATTSTSSAAAAYIASCLKTSTIASGDTCTSILAKNTLIMSDFLKWNPFVDQGCSNLMIGEVVCVNAPGKTVPSSTSAAPAPTYVSSCTKTTVVKNGDSCFSIATAANVQLNDLLKWNSAIVGQDCSLLQANQVICIAGPASPTSSSATSAASSAPQYIPGCLQSVTVSSGDNCATFTSKYAILKADFLKWNPFIDTVCSNLAVGESVCVNAPGKTIPSSTSAQPQPTYVQSCSKTITVQQGDTCSTIASAAAVKLADFLTWNSDIVGQSCLTLQAGQTLCIAGPTSSQSTQASSTAQVTPKYISTCTRTATIASGDTCSALLSKNSLLLADLLLWNPFVDSVCSNLAVGDVLCVDAPGKTIPSSTSAVPAATYVSTCTKTVTVTDGNTCSTIASDAKVALSDFLSWNSDIVGSTCLHLQIGQKLCVAGPVSSVTATTTTASSTAVAYIASCLQTATIAVGDSCSALLTKHTLALSDLLKWNPSINPGCSNLMIGETVCVDAPGKLVPTSAVSSVASSAPSAAPMYTSLCTKTAVIASGDTCAAITLKNNIITSDFLRWNPFIASDCSNLSIGTSICVNAPDKSSVTSAAPSSSATFAGSCTQVVTVTEGNSCFSLQTLYQITFSQLQLLNPSLSCENLQLGQQVCVKSPDLPTSTSVSQTALPSGIANCSLVYTVVAGDSCTSIANKAQVDLRDLLAWNAAIGASCASLQIGQSLCVTGISTIPAQPTFTNCTQVRKVSSGDTCASIAANASISFQALLAWNPQITSNCNNLSIGASVCVSGPPISTGSLSPSATSAPTTLPSSIANCSAYHTIAAGDDCGTITLLHNISVPTLTFWNPQINTQCSNLVIGNKICVSSSVLPPATNTSTVLPTDTFISDCTRVLIVANGTCSSISTDWHISVPNLLKWNPSLNQNCTNLSIGQRLCTNSPSLVTPANSSCTLSHEVLTSESCSSIALKYSLTLARFLQLNPSVDAKCANLQVGQVVCVTPEPATSSALSKSPTLSSTSTTSTPSVQPLLNVNSYTSNGVKYTYSGCMQDSASRVLPNKIEGWTSGTIEGCLMAAASRGFLYAGIENGNECWASQMAPSGAQLGDSSCKTPCKGNSLSACGGGWALSIYSGSLSAINAQTKTMSDVTWTYSSCFGEPANGRALANKIIDSGATIESCLALATQQGYINAGLEYGGECWASSDSTVYGGKIPESFCAMTCTSNVGQICGNGNVLSLYKASKVSSSAQAVGKNINGQSWQYMSCWGEPQYGRALDTPIDINGNPTVDSCLAAGAARGLKYCGLEYGRECYCSNNKPWGGKIPESYCDMKCAGNNQQTCGSGNVLSVWARA